MTVGRRGASAIANSTRSVFAGGFGSPTRVDTIDYVTIQSTGDAADFGNLVAANNNLGTCQSSVRGIIAGGQSPGNTNVIQYITTSTTGNAQDFGDLTAAMSDAIGCGNATRGVHGGGLTPSKVNTCLLYTSPSPRDGLLSRMPSSA